MRWCWVKLPVPGRPTDLAARTVGHGPTVLAVVRVGVVWTFFSRLFFLPSSSLSLGDDPV